LKRAAAPGKKISSWGFPGTYLWGMPSLRFLRAVSLTEGLSFLLLLLVAMPLKYAWGYPHAVQYLGWAHGALFLTLHGLLLQALVGGRLPFKTVCLIALAAWLPTGPLFADRLLRTPPPR
jgi:integral membrane protein